MKLEYYVDNNFFFLHKNYKKVKKNAANSAHDHCKPVYFLIRQKKKRRMRKSFVLNIRINVINCQKFQSVKMKASTPYFDV